MKAVPADDLRARQRRRVIRNIRRSIVNALLRLAARTGGKPGNAIRVSARGLERTLKRAERAVAPRQPQAPSIAGGWRRGGRAGARNAALGRRPPARPGRPAARAHDPGAPVGRDVADAAFDGHPECHAIPHELSTLLPTSLPLPREADRAWKVLQNPMLEAWFVGGLRAGKGS